jgi:hypothetical protein
MRRNEAKNMDDQRDIIEWLRLNPDDNPARAAQHLYNEASKGNPRARAAVFASMRLSGFLDTPPPTLKRIREIEAEVAAKHAERRAYRDNNIRYPTIDPPPPSSVFWRLIRSGDAQRW